MANLNELSPGDVASLKGGGPMLNVFKTKDLEGEEHAECFWLDEKAQPHKAMIPVACLKKQAGTKQPT